MKHARAGGENKRRNEPTAIVFVTGIAAIGHPITTEFIANAKSIVTAELARTAAQLVGGSFRGGRRRRLHHSGWHLNENSKRTIGAIKQNKEKEQHKDDKNHKQTDQRHAKRNEKLLTNKKNYSKQRSVRRDQLTLWP